MKLTTYRTWASALWLTAIGGKAAALWSRSSNWPLSIDADGLTLRYWRTVPCRRVPWSSISRIGVSRSYLDGHVCEMRIHHRGGVSKISVRGLRDGEEAVGAVLTMFKRKHRGRPIEDPTDIEPMTNDNRLAGDDRRSPRVKAARIARQYPEAHALARHSS
jgi:hypothetical protein